MTGMRGLFCLGADPAGEPGVGNSVSAAERAGQRPTGNGLPPQDLVARVRVQDATAVQPRLRAMECQHGVVGEMPEPVYPLNSSDLR